MLDDDYELEPMSPGDSFLALMILGCSAGLVIACCVVFYNALS